ncbi:polysaccharide deacetylase family protein [Paenibacillus sp. KQZ6P-2]|uniref:Polysaccharide deacetylase family protein n=1 Tax=Paenibacillus mangrovi TaxID=2931978 RepID=A0A9X1WTX0_9BACL|nr:polysaccharide deacetylase family protein [Paenibacillus mangrovi]MCJ8014606.1 polysaccharide deacetylase family protein [Paenibacillus mangrovi]
MRIRFDRFPGGVHKALTLSFDDGRIFDRRLIGKFNEYGLKGAFHLNSGTLGKEGFVTREEACSLYMGHEVSCHTVSHPFLEQSPMEQMVQEIMEDRKGLEAIVGYPVRGMSYPFGTYNDQLVSILPSLGMEYARTATRQGGFDIPSDFLRWHPTCHHSQMVDYANQFVDLKQRHTKMALFYVWGHSYEFENDNNWELIDRFGEIVARKQDIWFATSAEIVSYIHALRQLRFSADYRIVHNPSAQCVWVSVETDVVELAAGQLTVLG